MKKILTVIWNEFIYGGHLLSLGASSIVFVSGKLLDVPTTWSIYLVAYLFAQVIYLFNRYKEIDSDIETNAERSQHLNLYKKIFPYYIAAYALTAYLIMFTEHRFTAILFSLAPLAIGLAYTLYLKKLTSKIVGLKTFIVSLDWAFYVPFTIFYAGKSFSLLAILLMSYVFFRLITNTVFFDTKDLRQDSAERLKTIPAVFGYQTSKKVIILISFFSIIPLFIGITLKILPPITFALVLFGPYVFLYFVNFHSKIKMLNYYLVADGEYILWSLLVLLVLEGRKFGF